MFKKANKLGQETILYWCYFIEKYDKRIDNLVTSGVKKKTATSMIYQEFKQLLPEITDVNLHQKILRVRKLFKLFNTLGLEIISQVSYSTDAILSFNYQQIQNVIDYMNSVTSSHNETETVKIFHDQSHVTSQINLTNTYIPLKATQSKPTPIFATRYWINILIYIENLVAKISIIMELLKRHHACYREIEITA
ncbi:hypothetical protein RclHR1_04250007 [Rhizophagus clarus]|uniref:Uncharacterized protein n=1 Tax=Rhizophagus clarus TaxID=94130 RepID=A0A2Z6RHU6_9GLOM|nr:hypothetical protein RclHR1_04250007 [Rhizophagus clarus]